MFERLSYKARRRWALVVLVIGMPIYVMVAVSAVSLLPPLSPLVQLVVFVVLGIAWILPFKGLFKGIGQPDPDAPDEGDL